jgi:hypothetical protein
VTDATVMLDEIDRRGELRIIEVLGARLRLPFEIGPAERIAIRQQPLTQTT